MNTDLAVIRGDTVPLTVTVQANGAALNITGYSVYFIAKAKSTDPDTEEGAVIYKKVSTFTAPSSGIAEIVLSVDDTDVPGKKYPYKIFCVSGTGVKTTLFHGALTVEEV